MNRQPYLGFIPFINESIDLDSAFDTIEHNYNKIVEVDVKNIYMYLENFKRYTN